jgi:hypothetical protein
MKKLSKKQIDILNDVISAARDGRYCYGDIPMGIHVYVAKGNPKQVITTDYINEGVTLLTASESDSRLKSARPQRSPDVVTALEALLRK